jgi:hypothetical protein
MSRSKDPLQLSGHWHIDYRIESELPEDTVVGKRFLINAGFTVLAVAAFTCAVTLGWHTRDLWRQIDELEAEIRKGREEVSAIDAIQSKFDREADKVDQAYKLVRPRIFVSEFVSSLGRTRPERMAIDLIEWNDNTIILRGGLRERSTAASITLGDYISALKAEPTIGPLFSNIQLMTLDSGEKGGMMRFEIRFTLREIK